MEEETDGPSEEDGVNHVLSVSSTLRDLQTAYLVISLVLSVGCGLLLIFLVWKKENLQRPSNFLRCNLAVDDIVFTSCLIPFRIYALFQHDASGGPLWCSVRQLVAPPCLLSMYGTYLLMAVDLYYFVCDPLHYHDKVTTKRVVLGIVTVRVLSLVLGLVPAAFLGQPEYGLLCENEPANSVSSSTSSFRIFAWLVFLLVALSIPMFYYRVFKEARRQQERDENRDLWVFQTRAFKTMAPHGIVWTVFVATAIFQLTVERAKEQMSQYTLLIADHVSALLVLTLSSMANPIIYSFRLPDFRRAMKELCGRRTNQPELPSPRNRGMEMAAITGPGQGAPATESTPAPTSVEGPRPTAWDAPSGKAHKQMTQTNISSPRQAPRTEYNDSERPFQQTVRAEVHAEPTRSGEGNTETLTGQLHSDDVPTATLDIEIDSARPYRLTVRAEVHAEPTRSGEGNTETLPGHLHSDDVPTSTLDTQPDEATVRNTENQFASQRPPARPKSAWQEGKNQ
ncbi:ADRB2 [Branchiostoma lanceolatum]|uniref:ADRB2 protein n=1 Tax=Branchiostoma lanceolatum TaxID=7740 RepID=A0A8K0ENZ3_BRALA|nr:ADRB2 [Branchiostoma lanceolatum]